jgi:hypothetical protein
MRNDAVAAGSSLVEVLAVLTLTCLLLALVVGICIAQLRLARATADRAAITEAARTTAFVLSGEARRMTRDDVRALSGDSISVRAFRGVAIPCSMGSDGAIVRYSGDRLPDSGKDSVLVLTAAGSAVLTLLGSTTASASCIAHSGESIMEWRFDGNVPPASVMLIFESGSYHLSGRALRYRMGAAGRQPLTAEALRHPGSRFTSIDDDALRFDIESDHETSGHTAWFAPPGTPQ